MSRKVGSAQAVIGLRVKSGWATAVLLAGPVQTPRVVDRRRVDLSDPLIPESSQPYHADPGKLEEDHSKVAALQRIVRHVTNRSVANLLKDYRNMGYEVDGVGLVVGSLIDPASIKNTHIRAHALEGKLFRTVLEEAVKSHKIPFRVLVERQAYPTAAALLVRSEDEVKRALSGLGKSRTGPWRADEKMAALAAWIVQL